ncbi:DUF72 domain-containing protein, partial [Staphylococcus cohnii]|uniref:DUF72 domain-containing protein n=1 Tax=Staphylococcus cohnii TaxID=29382 RepID=UPI0034DB3EF6
MINIPLTPSRHHHTFYQHLHPKSHNLITYPTHFPILQLHPSYYPIQPQTNITKSITHTPHTFQFILKIHHPLTLHPHYHHF